MWLYRYPIMKVINGYYSRAWLTSIPSQLARQAQIQQVSIMRSKCSVSSSDINV